MAPFHVSPRARSSAPESIASRAAKRSLLLIAALALPAAGCVSAHGDRALSGTYALATRRLDERTPAPAADAPPEAVLDSPLERDAVVALAVARSPSLAAMAHRARAMIHAGRAERALPSPEVGASVWNLPLARPYALGEANMYMVELRQRFPVAGGRDGRANAMAEEAQAALAELASEERLTAQLAADAFAEYAQAAQERAVETRQLALL